MTCSKLTLSPVLLGFQPPNFTQVLLQPSSTRLGLKLHHQPINELEVGLALGRQLLFLTGKASPPEMAPCKVRGLLFQPVWA